MAGENRSGGWRSVLIGTLITGGVGAAILAWALNRWLGPPAPVIPDRLTVELVQGDGGSKPRVDPEPKPIVDPMVKAATIEVPVNPPLMKEPFQIAECKTFCKGCPSDHSSFELVLFNDSDEEITATRGEFNPGDVHMDSVASPPRVTNCQNSNYFSNDTFIDLDITQLKPGRPVNFDISVVIPAHTERTIGVSFIFKNLNPPAFPYLRASGTLTLYHKSGKARMDNLMIAGD